MLRITGSKFTKKNSWVSQISNPVMPKHLNNFDQNGYDLTLVEVFFALNAGYSPMQLNIIRDRMCLVENWIDDDEIKYVGNILNHGYIFHRRNFSEEARDQVENYCRMWPIFNKLIKLRAKWGLDFSLDYADNDRCFEVLHWEWDSFNYDQIVEVKGIIEEKLINYDWDDVADSMWEKREQWINLDFFGQSDWKCNYLSIPKEQFKMVSWGE